MKLLFDLQGLQNGSRDRGIGRYVRNLFDALAKREDIELFGLLNGAMGHSLQPAMDYAGSRIGSERVLVFPGIADTEEQFSENKTRRKLCEAAYETFLSYVDADALLVGSAVEGFGDDTCLSLKAPDATYLKSCILYDLIPLLDPDKYLGDDKSKTWYFDRISQLQSADLLLAISDSSRIEAVEHLQATPQSAVAISTAIDQTIFRPMGSKGTATRKRLGITKPFIMHASAIEPRKNFDGLIKAFGQLPPDLRTQYQLVLVGKADEKMREHLMAVAHNAGLTTDDVIMLGYVPDQQLAELYRACALFVFPSFHEGFGLPALEAMACGCATIGSNITSVPEVIGNPAYTFDPSAPSAISDLMKSLLADDAALGAARRHALQHAACFSWDKVAEQAVTALKDSCRLREKNVSYPSAQHMASTVAERISLQDCPDRDMEALARCLVASEDVLVKHLAAEMPKKNRTWRIEGPFDSTYSLALVNRETARAMADLGWPVALHSTEGPGDFPANPEFLTANPDLAAMHKRAAKVSQKRSFAASRLLYPPRVTDMAAPINALHHYAWEESGFPHSWVDDFNASLTMMTTLSTHIEKILIDNGVSVPMITSGCGVDHWDRIVPDHAYRVDARRFRFLHVSSCFPRKGVDALLAAYGEAFSIDDDVSLIIKTFDNLHNEVRQMLADLQSKNPRYPHVVTIFGDISDAQLKALYSQCQVMVGPSFAEGYGLPFAEAMLSGIPVITTNWGGQLDFCNPSNSWLVDYRFERAKTHLGVWTSAWARVDVASLVQAMHAAYHASPETRAAMAARGREQLMARHKWKHVAERLTAAAVTLPAIPDRKPRIGFISTWNSKCGIATYSQHLVEAMGVSVTIFSPDTETPLPGTDNSIRIWRQSKSDSCLWKITQHPMINSLDVVVIQFNFAFFNHADLATLIRRLKAMGKTIIIVLHSTTYPMEDPQPENFHLEWLVWELALCDRVLVHSIKDLNRLKDIGLVANVALFPHGVVHRPIPPTARAGNSKPTIATYGFALPHKGLPEILEGVRLLHNRGRKVRLKMVNAEYPADVSASLVRDLKAKVAQLRLDDSVEMHNDFLTDTESMALLTDADLVVYPYQNTEESASGAVRYGMAVERPVAVTPLPIFDDLAGAAFRMKGTSPADIADGIAAALDAIASGSPAAVAIAENAETWRDQHDYRVVGKRLFNICKALMDF
ncbi:MAG: glycosyltransferase [Erythrobacter sp.]